MSKQEKPHPHDAWASFRFAIVGPLLARPPGARGALLRALTQLAQTSWRHPITGEPVKFAVSTIEIDRGGVSYTADTWAASHEKRPDAELFLLLGGDSLRAVTLFLKVQQQFGKDLPLATLAHASTIADLAKLIDGESDAPDLSGYRFMEFETVVESEVGEDRHLREEEPFP